ncbi:FecCD family ABC transporter permease [Arhodomonas sp. SL1]|uniref:FecCD family ABC transporter permease n=1 Tax=Arhodomonas sp. SL1 TaxID=3425691 RepID=UPI003F883BFB
MPRAGLFWLAGLAALAMLSLLVAAMSGSLAIPLQELPAALWGEGTAHDVVWSLRLPRALAGFITGGLLALAGALMQVLLRNPLADPYVLGISGGAATGALGAMLLGLGAIMVSGSAFAGALASMALVFGLAHGRGGWTPTRLLLNGVVVAAGWGAVVSFLLAVGPARELRGMLFWLMGDLAGASPAVWPLLALLAGLGLALAFARELNLLARGELQARALGVAIGRLRLLIYLLASLLTASAVTIAGTVGFVGLVIPHLLRLAIGTDHRLLLPAAVLLGGSFLVLADTLARTAFAPQQLPVGVFSAFIGVPVFLFLLYRGGREVA